MTDQPQETLTPEQVVEALELVSRNAFTIEQIHAAGKNHLRERIYKEFDGKVSQVHVDVMMTFYDSYFEVQAYKEYQKKDEVPTFIDYYQKMKDARILARQTIKQLVNRYEMIDLRTQK